MKGIFGWGGDWREFLKFQELQHHRRRTPVNCRRPPPDFHLATTRRQSSVGPPPEARHPVGPPPEARVLPNHHLRPDTLPDYHLRPDVLPDHHLTSDFHLTSICNKILTSLSNIGPPSDTYIKLSTSNNTNWSSLRLHSSEIAFFTFAYLSKEEGRDCKDLRHTNPSSEREDQTLRNHCSASFENEISSLFHEILSFLKEAILLNGSISNTNGSLMRRSLSMRWQLLVVSTSRYPPREIRLGQFLIVKYHSAASLAISSARGRDLPYPFVESPVFIIDLYSVSGKDDSLDLGVVLSQPFQLLLHARLPSDLVFQVIRASMDDFIHDWTNKPFRHGSDDRGRESRTTEQ
ncbi:hypothetical protein M5K25_002539 [Dendrobium thyrsiflorum]|uniref:Uncharacterized protein n=1 Tax=Dendrobium thyrsiflorum TaxID=117978 RepID=A0ABD0VU84_DENTH